MKLLAAIVTTLSFYTSVIHADTWVLPEPSASASPSGQWVLRILPGTRQTVATAVVFELSKDGSRYTKAREFPLINQRAPVTACISDLGEIFTFDDWGGTGHQHVAVCYSPEGKIKAEYTLAQLFPAALLDQIKEEHSSISSIRWRRGIPFINGPHVIIQDVLGGYVTLTEGMIDSYIPPPKPGQKR